MNPLNKLKRRTLLILLFVVFLILGPLILMSSFGYKLDEAFGFIKTGGVYLQSEIPNVSVFVNDKYVKENGVFLRNILIQKLRPNTIYKIRTYKEGYNDWRKDIYVYPSLVSEGHILMLPLDFEKREIFPFFDEKDKGVYTPIQGLTKIRKTLDGRIIPENEEYIKIVTLFEGQNPYEEKKEISKQKIKKEIASTTKSIIPEKYIKIGIKDMKSLNNLIEKSGEISWLQDGNIILYWVNKINSIPYYYCEPVLSKIKDINKEKVCNEKIVLDWQDDIKRFEYFPGRNDVWIVLTNNGIYAVEVDPRSQRNIQTIYKGENLDFRLNNSGNLIVKDKGTFIEISL